MKQFLTRFFVAFLIIQTAFWSMAIVAYAMLIMVLWDIPPFPWILFRAFAVFATVFATWIGFSFARQYANR
jgi:hypothetical protein